MEEAHLIDQDVIVVVGWTEEDLTGEARLQGLTAAQEGRVLYFTWQSDLAAALRFAGCPTSSSLLCVNWPRRCRGSAWDGTRSRATGLDHHGDDGPIR